MKRGIVLGLAVLFANIAMAEPDSIQQSVWVNEAIVSTYTYDYSNFLDRQKAIAKYFTSKAWIDYSSALSASKLPETVKKNMYEVSAVATLPPVIKSVGPQVWEAQMPILVVYKNPQYQQTQTLDVTLSYTEAPVGQGIRGLAILSMQTKVVKPACKCMNS